LTLPASSSIHPLSLHDALPIYLGNLLCDFLAVTLSETSGHQQRTAAAFLPVSGHLKDRIDTLLLGVVNKAAGINHNSVSLALIIDRKSTRLNSSHVSISYAVFC